jgi:hypothetical protein
MQRVLFMARWMRCPRRGVVAGAVMSDTKHWWVYPWSSRKSMPNPVEKTHLPIGKLVTPKFHVRLIQSYPCIFFFLKDGAIHTSQEPNMYSMWLDSGSAPRCIHSIKLPSFQGCSFWVAAYSYINQSKSSHLSSVSFFSHGTHPIGLRDNSIILIKSILGRF